MSELDTDNGIHTNCGVGARVSKLRQMLAASCGASLIDSMSMRTKLCCIIVCFPQHSYFYQGALDVYKSKVVYIGNCTFEHNGPAFIFKPQQYRGHAGGLSIGTEEESTDGTRMHFMVTGCTFRNNTSSTPPDELGATTRVLIRFVFPGRGGGCSILVNTSSPANTTIKDCVFEDNIATTVAGALYLGFSGHSSHDVVVNNTKFVRNRSDSGGAIHYGFLEGHEQGDSTILVLSNTEFVENSAQFGGGMHIFLAGKQEVHLRCPINVSSFACFSYCECGFALYDNPVCMHD